MALGRIPASDDDRGLEGERPARPGCVPRGGVAHLGGLAQVGLRRRARGRLRSRAHLVPTSTRAHRRSRSASAVQPRSPCCSGNVENRGIEITLNVTPIKNQDFTWSFNLNYAKNINEVLSIYPGSPEFELNTDGFMTRTKVVEGKPFGEMYSRGYLRDSATGQILVRDDGVPQISAGQTVYIGNSRPDWIGGLGNRFTYKNLELSFLISARMGGEDLFLYQCKYLRRRFCSRNS